MKKAISIILLVTFSIAFLMLFYLAPYFSIKSLENAAIEKDHEYLSSHINIVELRENFKSTVSEIIEQSTASQEKNLPSEYFALNMANMISGVAIDNLLTTGTVGKIFRENVSDDLNISKGYDGFSKFNVSVFEKGNDKPKMVFVLSRKGFFGWELTSIRFFSIDSLAKNLVKQKNPKSQQTVQEQSSLFVSLDPFTVLLAPPKDDKYLFLALTIQAKNESDLLFIKENKTQIRTEILDILKSKTATELLALNGKSKLAEEIEIQIAKIIKKKNGMEPSVRAFFSSFIVQ